MVRLGKVLMRRSSDGCFSIQITVQSTCSNFLCGAGLQQHNWQIVAITKSARMEVVFQMVSNVSVTVTASEAEQGYL